MLRSNISSSCPWSSSGRVVCSSGTKHGYGRSTRRGRRGGELVSLASDVPAILGVVDRRGPGPRAIRARSLCTCCKPGLSHAFVSDGISRQVFGEVLLGGLWLQLQQLQSFSIRPVYTLTTQGKVKLTYQMPIRQVRRAGASIYISKSLTP